MDPKKRKHPEIDNPEEADRAPKEAKASEPQSSGGMLSQFFGAVSNFVSTASHAVVDSYKKFQFKAGARSMGMTPIHYAIYSNNISMAQALMDEEGADLEVLQDGTTTPLACAIEYKRTTIALALIQKGGASIKIRCLGKTPLDLAEASGQLVIVQALIDKGAKGRSPIHYALKNNQTQEALELVEKGENLEILCPEGEDTSPAPYEEKTPLHYAIFWGNRDVAFALLRKGVSRETLFKSRYLEKDMTPLHYAIELKRTEIALELIKLNVTLEPNLLHVAIKRNEIQIVLALIEKGMSLEALYNDMTPLHYAIELGCPEIVSVLIDKGANLNALYRGMTPLQHAIERHHEYLTNDYLNIVQALEAKLASVAAIEVHVAYLPSIIIVENQDPANEHKPVEKEVANHGSQIHTL